MSSKRTPDPSDNAARGSTKRRRRPPATPGPSAPAAGSSASGAPVMSAGDAAEPPAAPIYSCAAAANADRVADAFRLFVKDGAVGCDTTFGRGKFWDERVLGRVTVLATDLAKVVGVQVVGRPVADLSMVLQPVPQHVDLRALPYRDGTLDFVVLDPPYMGGYFREQASQVSRESDFADRYGHHAGGGVDGLYGMKGAERLYQLGIREAARVLKRPGGRRRGGHLFVKCMDQVENHRKVFQTDEVTAIAAAAGFRKVDALLVLRQDSPHLKRTVRGPNGRQQHARQNHSALLVFRRDPVQPLGDPVQQLHDAAAAATDGLATDEGYLEHSFVRHPVPTVWWEYYDYDVEARWAADGGDVTTRPSTAAPPVVLGRLRAAIAFEPVVRADIPELAGTAGFERAYAEWCHARPA